MSKGGRVWLTFVVLALIMFFCYPPQSYSIEEYSIQIEHIQTRPTSPVSDLPVFITVKVVDIFGDFTNGTLSYSIDSGKSWQKTPMNLVYGVPTDGTFRGTIPAQEPNLEVLYKIDFSDNIGYTGSLVDTRYQKTSNLRFPMIPLV